MPVKAGAEEHPILAGSSVVGAVSRLPGATSRWHRANVIDRDQFGRGHHGTNYVGVVLGYAPVVDSPLIDRSDTFRFAVATFDTGHELRDALHSLRQEGLRDDAFNCLGLEEVIADVALLALSPATARRTLLFSGQLRPISCTAGPLADRLAARLRAEAPTLKAALGEWLIPRHAEQIQGDVDQRRIVLWVRLLRSEDEPRAYRCLLERSSHSVGVHDLVAE
jgi:hypothetical protein